MDEMFAPETEPPDTGSTPADHAAADLPQDKHRHAAAAPITGGGIAALLRPRVAAAAPQRSPAFPASPRARAFRRRFFAGASAADWSDWRWQMRARIRSLAQLEGIFALSPDEREALGRHKGGLPVGITPYYASLMGLDDPSEPLRRTHIPVGQEYLRVAGEADDPLGEDHDTAAPGLVHRYPDRVLFLTTGTCSTYCRYCTRSRMVGQAGASTSSRPASGSRRSAISRRIPRSATCSCPAAIR